MGTLFRPASVLAVVIAVGALGSAASAAGRPGPPLPEGQGVLPALPAPSFPADASLTLGPTVQVSPATSSLPLRDLAAPTASATRRTRASGISFPATSQNFLGLGTTLGGCVFPAPAGGEPANCITTGDPPDPTGDVGPSQYVQLVNGGYAVWSKTGTMLQSPRYTNTLWAGYPTTDGNHCSSPFPGGDWGDGLVQYDQLADRWLITQFDITNGVNNNTGPSFQCIAVSKTGDPTGAYWLYDFRFNAAINDYAKIGVWPDGYYFSFNEFNPFFVDSRLAVVDRAAMLNGNPATMISFTNSGFGFLPSDLEGSNQPAVGTPNFYSSLGTNSVRVFAFHTDWATPGLSTFALLGTVTVAAFSNACGGGACIAQPSPGNQLASLGDRLMYRAPYRVLSDHDAVVLTHSVTAGAVIGPRWYEIRGLAAGSPSLFQQGTAAPNDGNSRWMPSIAMDRSGNIALGYSLSGTTHRPAIGLTGRLAGDPAGTMAQGESVLDTGGGVESGTFSDGSSANRWGDYSTMSVDPSDGCTFWYTNENYPSNGVFNWDTYVLAFRFAANQCGAPTVVRVSGLRARWTRGGVRISWRTADEAELAGFNLWRTTRNGSRRVNPSLIAARRLGTVSGAPYAYLDRRAHRGSFVEYRLQLVGLDGRRSWYGVGSAP